MKNALQVTLIVVLVLLAKFGRSFLVDHAPHSERAQTDAFVPTAEVAVVRQVERTLYVESQGTLVASGRLELLPEVGGRVLRVNPAVVRGAWLAKGTEILGIDPQDYELALEKAEAEVAAREASLNLEQALAAAAIADWKELHEGEPPVLVTRAPQLAAAEAALTQAGIGVRQARLALGRTVVVMPFDGRVLHRWVEPQQAIDPRTPVASLERAEPLEVHLPLGLGELSHLDLEPSGSGARDLEIELQASVGGRTQTWSARGQRTAPELDAANPVLTLIATLEGPVAGTDSLNTHALLPGLFVRARIQGRQGVKVTPIPRTALRDGDSVLVVDEQDRLQRRVVQVLMLTDSEALLGEPIGGPGTRLVTRSPAVVVEGMRVRVVSGDPATSIGSTSAETSDGATQR